MFLLKSLTVSPNGSHTAKVARIEALEIFDFHLTTRLKRVALQRSQGIEAPERTIPSLIALLRLDYTFEFD